MSILKTKKIGWIAVVLTILNTFVSQASPRNYWKRTNLHYAAFRCDLASVDRLLRDGISPNIRSKTGETPLMMTSFFGIENVFKKTPKKFFNEKNINSIIWAMGYQPMFRCINYQNPSCGRVAEKLIAAGAKINAIDVWGNTSLHYGLKFQKFSVVEVLIGFGASVEIKNRNGDSPYAYSHMVNWIYGNHPVGMKIHGLVLKGELLGRLFKILPTFLSLFLVILLLLIADFVCRKIKKSQNSFASKSDLSDA